MPYLYAGFQDILLERLIAPGRYPYQTAFILPASPAGDAAKNLKILRAAAEREGGMLLAAEPRQ